VITIRHNYLHLGGQLLAAYRHPDTVCEV